MVKKEETKKKENNKKKKGIIITIIIILLLILIFLLWWFNRAFIVTIKYNNGHEDEEVKVKYLYKVENANIDKLRDNSEFIGWFETYYLDGKQFEKVKEDSSLESSICKEGFKLNSLKTKCVYETEFDFKNTKITEDKTIEAMWKAKVKITFDINPTSKTIYVGDSFTIKTTITGATDKTINWSTNNSNIAIVDKNGNVKGIKEGSATITAVSNGISRNCKVIVVKKQIVEVDNGKVSLSSNKKCLIGNSETATITATLKNAKDKTLKWSLPKCYKANKVSNTVVKLTRNSCKDTEETSFKVTARLNNGKSDYVKINYEPKLEVTVTSEGTKIQPDGNGIYNGNRIVIKTNTDVTFTSTEKHINSKTSNSATMLSTCDDEVTVKTSCGQKKVIVIHGIIN